ncbi:efflux RND transporter permease subunit, partial [Candidatus Dojkabacteria bacterium]|nr:efflux RND transporter permease subunit [Candidatus Dojkabacteria bacterium]
FLYDSYLQPALVFSAVPLAFPGLFPGLFLTDNAISFFVMLGLIGLVGIVVNNSIMLLDFINHARKEGKGIADSAAQAVRIRFRPILTTSTTTIAGLFPLAISDPFWEGLSYSIIFGLISSSILVLLVFPAYYAVVEKVRLLVHAVAKKLLGR